MMTFYTAAATGKQRQWTFEDRRRQQRTDERTGGSPCDDGRLVSCGAGCADTVCIALTTVTRGGVEVDDGGRPALKLTTVAGVEVADGGGCRRRVGDGGRPALKLTTAVAGVEVADGGGCRRRGVRRRQASTTSWVASCDDDVLGGVVALKTATVIDVVVC